MAVDGKALRGRFDAFADQKAAQLLGAFTQEEPLLLGHFSIDTQSNEIPVAQPLIDELGSPGACSPWRRYTVKKNLRDRGGDR